MTRRNSLYLSFGDPRTADEKGNVDIFFDAAALAGRETVLADVEAIVGRVDQVRVFQDLGASTQSLDDGIDEFVYGLKGLQTLAVPVVVVVDLGLIELAKSLEVGSCSGLLKSLSTCLCLQ